jgi:hypothetical protein
MIFQEKMIIPIGIKAGGIFYGGLYETWICGTRIYNIWKEMRRRCNCKTGAHYSAYGGRGIRICSEWDDFMSFYSWSIQNGYDDTLTIDRIDVNGDYSPDNCRWVSMKEQENNRRNNHLLKYKGQLKTISQWAEIYGLSYRIIYRRLKAGWTIEEALTIQGRPGRYHKKRA